LRLLAELERAIGAEESLFRKQLLREDLARLRRLREIASTAADREAFLAAGRRLGWTQGDQRTGELQPALDALLDEVFAYERGQAGEAADERIRGAWSRLTRERVEKLVGCLSTPVPRLEE
jgi:hypothetical protein